MQGQYNISVKLTREQYAEVNRLAVERKQYAADIVAVAVAEYLERQASERYQEKGPAYNIMRAYYLLTGASEKSADDMVRLAHRIGAPSDAVRYDEDRGGWYRFSDMAEYVQSQIREKLFELRLPGGR